jgi:hypothetical protein
VEHSVGCTATMPVPPLRNKSASSQRWSVKVCPGSGVLDSVGQRGHPLSPRLGLSTAPEDLLGEQCPLWLSLQLRAWEKVG